MPKSKTYEDFIEKFKPQKTTDDCYTPPLVYEAVKGWVCKEYGIEEREIIRPFWPGEDFTLWEYPDGCVVVDNPPFSILSKIYEWYLEHGIKFFLFAPSLTVLSGRNVAMRMNHIICDTVITYENQAVVRTSFVTNLGDPDVILQTAPELSRAVNRANDAVQKPNKAQLPRYEYPDHIVTATMLQRYYKYGIDFKVKKQDCVYISKMDAQLPHKKAIFGGGLLLSTAKAKEKTEAEALERKIKTSIQKELEPAVIWELSEREREIIKIIDNRQKRDEDAI